MKINKIGILAKGVPINGIDMHADSASWCISNISYSATAAPIPFFRNLLRDDGKLTIYAWRCVGLGPVCGTPSASRASLASRIHMLTFGTRWPDRIGDILARFPVESLALKWSGAISILSKNLMFQDSVRAAMNSAVV